VNTTLVQQFNKIGAVIVIEELSQFSSESPYFVLTEEQNNYLLKLAKDVKANVIHIDSNNKELLLLIKTNDGHKYKFLCDNKTATLVPPVSGIKDVQTAKEALKTKQIIQPSDRKTIIYKKQADWFFIPMPDYFKPPDDKINKMSLEIFDNFVNTHSCEFIYTVPGIPVYVHNDYPNGLTLLQYNELKHKSDVFNENDWTIKYRDPQISVMGKITHNKCKPLILSWWHRVIIAEEANGKKLTVLY
jgi:hypothetical protein